jgi:serine O-acetyltransferase
MNKTIELLESFGFFLTKEWKKFIDSDCVLNLLEDIKYGLEQELKFVKKHSKTALLLGNIKKNIELEIENVKKKDPAAKTAVEIVLTYSGFHAVIMYRIAHFFYNKKLFTLARIISQTARFWTGVEIHPGAKIGKGLFIDHGMGVVIGETAIVGDNCLIYQGSTLGGTGKDTSNRRHPCLGNNVMVGAGSKVLGGFTVGDNAKIAANAVVLEDVPPNYTAVGVPAELLPPKGIRNDNSDLDQSAENPLECVKQQIAKMNEVLERLEEVEHAGLFQVTEIFEL